MEKDIINANSNRQQATLQVESGEAKKTQSEEEKRFHEAEAHHTKPPAKQEDNYDPNYANNEGQSV
jgi:hypothetical protein